MGKLGKKLKREAIANPKKAAILGIVTIVALYFWAPLLLGMIKKTASTESSPTVEALPNAVALEGAAAAKPPLDAAGPSWQQLVAWMQNDPRTKPAPPLQLACDPFNSAKSEPKTAQAEQEQPNSAPLLTPDAVGLVLTGTIIGPNSRIAQIGGKPYALGQMVDVPKDKAPVPTAFKLIDIGPRRAVLQLGPQQFELTIPQPTSEKIEIR